MALGPVQNGNTVPIGAALSGTLPNVSDVLLNWFQVLTFILIVKEVINSIVTETEVPAEFYGVRQPFTAEQLQIKPEGERSWQWQTIHAYPTIELFTDDRLIFDGVKYRVMDKSNYTEYGYIKYEICQDYETT